MWKKKGFKGLFKGMYRKRGKRRELVLVSKSPGVQVKREYPSWQAAMKSGWVLKRGNL